jgi:hypothetical protein
MKTTTAKLFAVVVLMLVGMLTVRAGPINGSIQIVGNTVLNDSSLATATTTFFFSTGLVIANAGDLTAIPFLSSITFTSAWNFNAGPIASFWSGSGFTFDLALSHVVNQSANFLNVAGIGTLSAAGFDPTPAVFDFTIPSSSNTKSVGYVASVSTNLPVVPDTATTGVLAGLCLAGLMGLKTSLRPHRWAV